MDYTLVIYLISTIESQDSMGNIIETKQETKTLAKWNNVSSKEFYAAQSVGITPQAELQIKASNYNGEKLVRLDGKVYSVIRTMQKFKKREDIVLVLGEKTGYTDD